MAAQGVVPVWKQVLSAKTYLTYAMSGTTQSATLHLQAYGGTGGFNIDVAMLSYSGVDLVTFNGVSLSASPSGVLSVFWVESRSSGFIEHEDVYDLHGNRVVDRVVPEQSEGSPGPAIALKNGQSVHTYTKFSQEGNTRTLTLSVKSFGSSLQPGPIGAQLATLSWSSSGSYETFNGVTISEKASGLVDVVWLESRASGMTKKEAVFNPWTGQQVGSTHTLPGNTITLPLEAPISHYQLKFAFTQSILSDGWLTAQIYDSGTGSVAINPLTGKAFTALGKVATADDAFPVRSTAATGVTLGTSLLEPTYFSSKLQSLVFRVDQIARGTNQVGVLIHGAKKIPNGTPSQVSFASQSCINVAGLIPALSERLWSLMAPAMRGTLTYGANDPTTNGLLSAWINDYVETSVVSTESLTQAKLSVSATATLRRSSNGVLGTGNIVIGLSRTLEKAVKVLYTVSDNQNPTHVTTREAIIAAGQSRIIVALASVFANGAGIGHADDTVYTLPGMTRSAFAQSYDRAIAAIAGDSYTIEIKGYEVQYKSSNTWYWDGRAGDGVRLNGPGAGNPEQLMFGSKKSTTFQVVNSPSAASHLEAASEGGVEIQASSDRDTIAFAHAADPTSGRYDTVRGFDAAMDRFDLWQEATVAGMDASITHGRLSSGDAFERQLESAVNGSVLQANHAASFTPDSGSLAHATFLVADVNGVAGYQAGQDLVVRMIGTTGAINAANFV